MEHRDGVGVGRGGVHDQRQWNRRTHRQRADAPGLAPAALPLRHRDPSIQVREASRSRATPRARDRHTCAAHRAGHRPERVHARVRHPHRGHADPPGDLPVPASGRHGREGRIRLRQAFRRGGRRARSARGWDPPGARARRESVGRGEAGTRGTRAARRFFRLPPPLLRPPEQPRAHSRRSRRHRACVGEGQTLMATTTKQSAATHEEYLQLHRWMCMAKALDDRMHILVKHGRAPFVGSSRGHEGIQVASTAAIGPDDWLVPHYRGLANALVRGLTMKEWMLAGFAKAGDPLSAGRNIPGGCYSYPRAKIAPVSPGGARLGPQAAGIAYGTKLAGDGAVTLCTFGDGATSQGDFHEGVNFAAAHKLPVVFVCENNGYAISVPIRLQMANPDVADRARGYGMVGVTVDGTDVPAAYAVCKEAVERARRGEGPTLIDAKIWRINSHTSEDNQLKYRSKEEISDAAEHDPIERFRSWLVERGWIAAEEAVRIQAVCDPEASDAADWAEQQPDPVPEDALTHLFS